MENTNCIRIIKETVALSTHFIGIYIIFLQSHTFHMNITKSIEYPLQPIIHMMATPDSGILIVLYYMTLKFKPCRDLRFSTAVQQDDS